MSIILNLFLEVLANLSIILLHGNYKTKNLIEKNVILPIFTIKKT